VSKRRRATDVATRPAAVHAAVALAPKEPTQAQQVASLAIADSRRGQGLGFPQLVYNPDELARRKGGLRVYDRMLTDDQVRACYEFKRAVTIGPGWQLTPQDDDDARQMALTALLIDDLERLTGPFEDVMSQMLTALPYGFSLGEKNWAVDDGREEPVPAGRRRTAKRPNLDATAEAERDRMRGARLRLLAIPSIAPHHIEFLQSPYGEVLSVQQMGNTNGELPPGKFVHFVPYGDFQNPYGTSELRAAYDPWFHKQHWTQAAAIWGEKLADGPIIIKHPPTEATEKVQTARNTAANLQARTAMAVPNTYDVSILEGGRDPHSTFVVMIEHQDRRIAKAMLIPDKMGISGGEVQGGSYSLAETQAGMFLHVLTQLQRRLVACVQEQIIDQMAAFADPTIPPPRFGLLPLSEENRQEVVTAWVSLQGTQSWPVLLRDVNHIRELMGLRALSEEEWTAYEAEKEQRRQEMAAQAKPPSGGAPPADDEEDDTAELAARVVPTAVEGGTPPASFWRDLTPPEQRMDLAAVRSSIEGDTATVGMALAEGAEAIVAAVRKAATKLLPDPDPTAVRALSVSSGVTAPLRKRLQADLLRSYDAGRAQAKATLRRARQDVQVAASAETDPILRVLAATKPGLIGAAAEKFFRAKAFWITGLLEERIVTAAQGVLFNAVKGDKLPRHIEQELDDVLNPWLPERDSAGKVVNVPARIETIARTNVAEAQNEARYAVFTDPDLEGFVEALQYSAIMDDRVRSTHAAWDGVVKPASYWLGPPDRRPPCGFQCRCTLVPIVATDDVDVTDDAELPTVQPFPDEGFK
jgi:SPP1 gp7 family putative phage head morphogenesis protein